MGKLHVISLRLKEQPGENRQLLHLVHSCSAPWDAFRNGKKKANQTVQQTLISASKRASCCPALGTTPRPLGMEVERFWLESQQENRSQAGVEHSSGAVLYPQAQLQEPSCMPAQLSPSPSRTESQQADVCSTGRPWGEALQKGSTPPQLHKQGCKARRGTSRGTAAPPCSWP